jgi:signal transduction histidine kinase
VKQLLRRAIPGDDARAPYGAARIVAVYAALGIVWILVSDLALAAFVESRSALAAVQSVKGFAYVIVTAILLWVLVRRDISVLKATASELEQANRQLETLAGFARLSPHPFLELGPGGAVLYANEAALAAARATGLDPVAALLPDDIGGAIEASLAAGQPSELTARARTGSLYQWLLFPAARADRVYAHGTDVTELTELQARLAQAGRVESLGRLAGGVAHDLNNLLTVVQANASLLEMTAPGHETEVAEIGQAADRAGDIVRRLIGFARQQESAATTVDLNEELRRLQGLLRHLVRPDVTVEGEFADGVLPVNLSPGQVAQLVTNLVTNASDAMPRGGTVHICTRREGASALMTVADTGTGMDEGTLARVFEPFFTTKAGRGTGLGLFSVQSVVANAGGTVSVDSHPGEGTTFRISLPLAAPGQGTSCPPARERMA